MKTENKLVYVMPQAVVLFMAHEDILTLSNQASGDAVQIDWSVFDIGEG